jgi:hypothetical protein
MTVMSRDLLPTPSLAVSITALVVAMGGTGYAATKLSGSNIKTGTITGKQIKSHSLGTGKLSAKTIVQLHGATGPAGPAGAAGPAGPAGARGPAGATSIAGLTRPQTPPVDLQPGVQKTTTVPCPSGTVVVGGGVSAASSSTQVNINSSYPLSEDSWRADVNNGSNSVTSFTVYAICVQQPAAGQPPLQSGP